MCLKYTPPMRGSLESSELSDMSELQDDLGMDDVDGWCNASTIFALSLSATLIEIVNGQGSILTTTRCFIS